MIMNNQWIVWNGKFYTIGTSFFYPIALMLSNAKAM